jgi:hypothetical protein
MTSRTPAYEGSCLCGRVRYRFLGPLGTIDHCHCADCRKSHAAAFATYIEVPARGFEFLQGEDQVTTHGAASGTRRSFCRHCGSIVTCCSAAEPEGIGVPASTLDTPFDARPEFHTYVRSKASWYDIRDGLPQYQTTRSLPGPVPGAPKD